MLVYLAHTPLSLPLLRDTERSVRDSWEPCCFSLCDPGGLGGMRGPLSARGRDRDLIRPSVCRDQRARVNQRQTEPSSPRGFTRFDPDTLACTLSHKDKHTVLTKAHSLTPFVIFYCLQSVPLHAFHITHTCGLNIICTV